MRVSLVFCFWVFALLCHFSVSAFAGDISLKWAPAADATHYVVYWGTESGTYLQNSPDIRPPSPLPAQMTYTVSGLTEGTTYYFAVKAFNACNHASNFSSEVSGRPLDTDTDKPPIADTGEATLKWTPSADATHYVVYWGTKSGVYPQNSADIPQPSPLTSHVTYTVSGLSEGSTYYFAVRAFNPCNQASDFTNEISGMPGPPGTPDEPEVPDIPGGDKFPLANAGRDQTAREGQNVTLDGSASLAADGAIASWAWQQTGGPTVTLAAPNEALTRFVAPKSLPGGIDLTFTLTVTNTAGLSHSDDCTVTVTLSEEDLVGDTSGQAIEILDSQLAHQDWLGIGWDFYRANSNEARVAAGDLDGDGNQELVIGLGPVENDSAIPGGFFQIVSHDYKHLAWGQIPWTEYNDYNGETHPTCGDLNGDGVDEIVVGLGAGGQGKLAVFSYNLGHVALQQWISVPWDEYNEWFGETRPAIGNLDNDACPEIVVGLGSDMENGITANGQYAILDRTCDDDLTTPFELKTWGQGTWEEYNAMNGATWPVCGDIGGDQRDEIILGLGIGGAGKTELVEYTGDVLNHLSWLTVDWSEYNSQHGETRPAYTDTDSDGTAEILVGLAPVADNQQLPDGRFAIINADQSASQWGQINSEAYNRSNGESWPVPFRSEGRDLIAIGLGPYTPDTGTGEEGLPSEPGAGAGAGASGCFINACGGLPHGEEGPRE